MKLACLGLRYSWREAIFVKWRSLSLCYRPIVAGFLNVLALLLVPFGTHGQVVVHVKLAINNGPSARLSIGFIASAHAKSAVTSKLRGKLLRIGLEHLEVFGRSKMPNSALITKRKFILPFGWLRASKISNRIVYSKTALGC